LASKTNAANGDALAWVNSQIWKFQIELLFLDFQLNLNRRNTLTAGDLTTKRLNAFRFREFGFSIAEPEHGSATAD
jgi:hypothetical protein